jgi:hypothetical protein
VIAPAHAAPGGTIGLLLSCQKPVSLGFKGAFAPVKVLIYDEASFRNLHYVNGRLQPISSSFPVRPPATPPFRVVGPDDVDVTVPASLQNGVYVVVIDDGTGEVASENLLNVP